jgi:hypothetical protein
MTILRKVPFRPDATKNVYAAGFMAKSPQKQLKLLSRELLPSIP